MGQGHETPSEALGDGEQRVSVEELDLVLTFLNVGHGDAAVLRFREEHEIRTIVIDGGGPDHAGTLVSYLLRNTVTNIDLLVATHIDRYHIAGLLPVVESKRISIRNFWGPSCESTEASVPGLRSAEERGYQRLYAKIAQQLRPENILCPTQDVPLPAIFEEPNVTVLSPRRPNVLRAAPADAPAKTPAELAREQDELAIVLLIECHRLRMLFGSDAGRSFWESLIANPELRRVLEVDILKVPSYGRPSGLPASVAPFLRAEYAVFSLGQKEDGGPSDEVLALMREMRSEVLCTQHTAKNSFCRNPHCPAGSTGQNVVFCRGKGDPSYSTSAHFCPLYGGT